VNDTSKYVFIAIIELCALNGTKDIQVPVPGLLLRSCLRENDEQTILESLQSLQSEGLLLEWKRSNSFFRIELAGDQKIPSASQDELEVVGSRAIRRALMYKLFSEYKQQNSTYVHFPLASLDDSLQATKEEIFEHVIYLQNEYYLKYEVMDGGMCTSDITHYGIKLCEIKSELFTVLGSIQVSDNKIEKVEEMSSDPKKVFVVHGRNDKARKAMFSFLRSMGLHPIEWLEAISYTGNSAPYIGEILDHAFKVAQAVVVLVTGDDFAMINPELAHKNDPDYETKPTPQARPNVLFEAGLALGRHPKRTVIVELGQNRPFSDIAGLHIVRLTDNVKTRQELAIKLKNAGCQVDIENKNDWMHEGEFEKALLLNKWPQDEISLQTGHALKVDKSSIKDSSTVILDKISIHDINSLRSNYKFEKRTGIHRHMMSDEPVCTSCLLEGVESPLTESEEGWQCHRRECNKFYSNPDFYPPGTADMDYDPI